jgi:transcriptional antiterminator Rof (Rho-off)
MSDTKYKPIDCGFHDILLDRITRGNIVDLEYSDSGKKCRNRVVLKNVYTRQHEEFLVFGEDQTIRLDQILSVDGICRPGMESCAV